MYIYFLSSIYLTWTAQFPWQPDIYYLSWNMYIIIRDVILSPPDISRHNSHNSQVSPFNKVLLSRRGYRILSGVGR